MGPPGEKGRGEKEKEPVAGLCGQRLGLLRVVSIQAGSLESAQESRGKAGDPTNERRKGLQEGGGRIISLSPPFHVPAWY